MGAGAAARFFWVCIMQFRIILAAVTLLILAALQFAEFVQSAEPVADKPLVTVYGPRGCPPCARAVREGDAIGKFDFCKEDVIPARIKRVADTQNQGPVVVFKDRDKRERWVIWQGSRDFEIRYERAWKPK